MMPWLLPSPGHHIINNGLNYVRKRVLVFREEGFMLPTGTSSVWRKDKNCKYVSLFHGRIKRSGEFSHIGTLTDRRPYTYVVTDVPELVWHRAQFCQLRNYTGPVKYKGTSKTGAPPRANITLEQNITGKLDPHILSVLSVYTYVTNEHMYIIYTYHKTVEYGGS